MGCEPLRISSFLRAAPMSAVMHFVHNGRSTRVGQSIKHMLRPGRPFLRDASQKKRPPFLCVSHLTSQAQRILIRTTQESLALICYLFSLGGAYFCAWSKPEREHQNSSSSSLGFSVDGGGVSAATHKKLRSHTKEARTLAEGLLVAIPEATGASFGKKKMP